MTPDEVEKLVVDTLIRKSEPPSDGGNKVMAVVMAAFGAVVVSIIVGVVSAGLGGIATAMFVRSQERAEDQPTQMALMSQEMVQVNTKLQNLDQKTDRIATSLEERTKDRIYRTEYDEDFRENRSRMADIEESVISLSRAVERTSDVVLRNQSDLEKIRDRLSNMP